MQPKTERVVLLRSKQYGTSISSITEASKCLINCSSTKGKEHISVQQFEGKACYLISRLRTPLANSERKYSVQHVIHHISSQLDLLPKSKLSKIPQQAKLVSLLRHRVAEGLRGRHVAALCSILGGSATKYQVNTFLLGKCRDHLI